MNIRKTLIALLDDANGISADGYLELQSLAITLSPGENSDIFNAVRSSEGRYYLPEDHGFVE